MFAKIIDEKTKQCEVGIGTNINFYKSIGMTEQKVEEAWNGSWYLEGYAPEKPKEELAEEKRAERNNLLGETDKMVLPDFPLSEEERVDVLAYREYLRHITEEPEFPHIEVLTLKEWKSKQVKPKQEILPNVEKVTENAGQ